MLPRTALTAEIPSPLSPDTPYTAKKSAPVTHDVEFSVIVTPPYHCK
ncbi:MAG TPA: transglutaminase, partial [Planctomycetaceae bacterium]|nr:transglutaminase [Planctomycetaceae bacterium]